MLSNITYLAYIIHKSNEIVSGMKDTLMVQKFSNIFCDSFPRLVPEREVKFSIEFTFGIMPISKTPYKIATTELQKLKKQLTIR